MHCQDNEKPISPGALCREYLISACCRCSVCQVDSCTTGLFTPVVMANARGDRISRCRVGELYPVPYLYRSVCRGQLTAVAKLYGDHAAAQSASDAVLEKMKSVVTAAYDEAKAMERHWSLQGRIHPLHIAAACLFDNGDIETARQLTGLEYGCTVDPVTLLVREMVLRRHHDHDSGGVSSGTSSISELKQQKQRRPQSKPIAIAAVDQFGVAHAPFAAARALLSEHGFGDVVVLADVLVVAKGGESVMRTATPASSLLPSVDGCVLLTHDDFN